MNKQTQKQFGLIGYPLGNTFSATYFTEKFSQLNLPYSYINFPIQEISELPKLVGTLTNLAGLNVTKPYKEQVIPYLDELADTALNCGAVNCIQILASGKKVGHNTDVIGFKKSLETFIGSNKNLKALVFGNGGAAKAVFYALNQLKIQFLNVSRGNKNAPNQINYGDLNADYFKEYQLLINTTPIGMFPEIAGCLPIDFSQIGSDHYCFDLIYLPSKTNFLLKAEANGAKVKNGLEMLHLQADAAFDIWMNS